MTDVHQDQPWALDFHPFSNLFPLLRDLDPARWSEFLDSLSASGLIDPIITFEGKILDGRNRYLGCQIRGIEPRFVEFTDLKLDAPGGYCVEPLNYAFDRNMQRRNLDADQRAAIWTEYYQLERKTSREARNAKLKRGAERPVLTKSSERESDEDTPAKTTRQKIAEKAEVSEYKAQQAMNLQRDHPELLKDVASGKLPLVQATKPQPAEKPAAKPQDLEGQYTKAIKRAIRDLCSIHIAYIDEAVELVPEQDRAFVASKLEAFVEGLRRSLPVA